MKRERKVEIDALRKRIAKLEAMEIREAEIRDAVEKVYNDFRSALEEASLSLEEVVRSRYREFKRVVEKIDKESEPVTASKPKARRKKAGRKKGRRKSAKPTLKIPAGKYSNIPPDTKAVFVVKERGPRPKLLKAHAESLGLDKFISECKKG